jgi:hypothetical protein
MRAPNRGGPFAGLEMWLDEGSALMPPSEAVLETLTMEKPQQENALSNLRQASDVAGGYVLR